MPENTDNPRPRRKTRVWEDDLDGWCFEVTHPAGHAATGAHLESKEAARAAAKAAAFHVDDTPTGSSASPPG